MSLIGLELADLLREVRHYCLIKDNPWLIGISCKHSQKFFIVADSIVFISFNIQKRYVWIIGKRLNLSIEKLA
jgi:hypothetical protein